MITCENVPKLDEDRADAALASQAEAGRIVVIDDDPGFAYAVRKSLERLGYRVVEFVDGLSAWEHLKLASPPSILIADLKLGRGQPNGLALARHARSYHRRLPVIYVSGHTELASLAEAKEGESFVEKPCNLDYLVGLVVSLIGPAR